jgi:hypothetical protein
MAAIAHKIKYRDDGATVEITLYDSADDIRSEYLELYPNGADAFAPLGAATHPEAASLRIRKDGATFSFLSTRNNPTVIEILKDFLDTNTTITPNTANFSTIDAEFIDRDYGAEIVFQDEQYLSSILKRFADSFNLDFYMHNGELYISWLDLTDITPTQYIQENQIIDFSIDIDMNRMINKVKYLWDFDYSSTKPKAITTSFFQNSFSISNWGERFVTLDMRWNSTSPLDQIQRLILEWKKPIEIGTLRLFSETASSLLPGHIISVKSAIAKEDSWTKYKIDSIDRGITGPVTTLTIRNIDVVSGSAFILGDEDVIAADWDDATESDRQYGYLCDETDGYFDNDIDEGKSLL